VRPAQERPYFYITDACFCPIGERGALQECLKQIRSIRERSASLQDRAGDNERLGW
jgi:hypothetical protein